MEIQTKLIGLYAMELNMIMEIERDSVDIKRIIKECTCAKIAKKIVSHDF